MVREQGVQRPVGSRQDPHASLAGDQDRGIGGVRRRRRRLENAARVFEEEVHEGLIGPVSQRSGFSRYNRFLHSPEERAGAWFLNSGIQEPSGGVARYYQIELGSNAAVSTEITGYTASALLYLAARNGRVEYRDAALRAGRFLTRAAWQPAAAVYPFELPAKRAYFFDSGIILRALAALWREAGDAEFRTAAIACGRSMAADFAGGCVFHPVLALPSKEPLPYEDRWSRSPGCYQLKAALGWRELGDSAVHYERVLGYSLREAAAFLRGRPDVMDRLHAFCYFLEGLLPEAARPECRNALERGISEVAARLRRLRPEFERSDVWAQLLRLRIYAEALAGIPLDEAAAAEEAAAIPGFQAASDDPRIDGAFLFGRKNGRMLPYANPVSTAFCLQALALWRDRRAGRQAPGWQTLI